MINKLLLIIASISLMACSQQDRYSEAPLQDNAEMEELVDKIMGDVNALGESNNLIYDKSAVIYYGEGLPGGSMGPAQSVFAFSDFSFIHPDIYLEDLEEARVVFLAAEQDGEYAMAIDIDFNDEGASALRMDYITEFYYQVSEPVFSFDSKTGTRKFELTMANGVTGEEIYLKSFDVNKNNELKSTIQLEVYYNPNGTDDYVGKFSTLQGR